ncbi:DUF393 domain-containing protein [bacterium]|nr:DUF393 domain-containing protein [bacterium]
MTLRRAPLDTTVPRTSTGRRQACDFFHKLKGKKLARFTHSINLPRYPTRELHQISHPNGPILFYDGDCALCQGSVKWLLARDQRAVLRFAPLGGETWQELVPEQVRATLPDSVVLIVARGSKPLIRSTAILTAMALMGPPWKKRAALLGRIPSGLRDLIYRAVARVRRLILGKPKSQCPMIPPEWRSRLLP